MDTWESFTTTFSTAHPDVQVPVHDDIPLQQQEFPKFSTFKLIPQLNYYGARGWELISIEPVQQGKNGDLRYTDSAGGQWTYTYFAAFKRRIPG